MVPPIPTVGSQRKNGPAQEMVIAWSPKSPGDDR
jgi:hypothetical protein